VRLNVMLAKDTPHSAVHSVARGLAEAAGAPRSPEILPASGMVFIESTLGAVQEIARRPEVVWLDTNTEAPVEELLDG
jgi:hypothetical protein